MSKPDHDICMSTWRECASRGFPSHKCASMFQYWHSHGLSGDANFNIGHASKKLDSEVLARARIAYDAMQRSMTFGLVQVPSPLMLCSILCQALSQKAKAKTRALVKARVMARPKVSAKANPRTKPRTIPTCKCALVRRRTSLALVGRCAIYAICW